VRYAPKGEIIITKNSTLAMSVAKSFSDLNMEEIGQKTLKRLASTALAVISALGEAGIAISDFRSLESKR
jgi:hypothetical protein